jgi:putative N6-adenine-specific DNA methylase
VVPVASRLSIFAVTAPGLEGVAAGELRSLGIDATEQPGGVAWSGSPADLYAANLHLRSASRVLVRLAAFHARSFIELERHARRVDYALILPPGAGVRLRVTSRKSRLYHERAIAERFARWITEATGAEAQPTPEEGDTDDEEASGGSASSEAAAAQLLVIRFHRDECTISADSSGALLHRRGYRRAVAKAPLRETLAAGILLACGWHPHAPLIDPFCGAGTIPIEAALIARRIPPGLAGADRAPRGYAFERWPSSLPDVWARLVAEARARIRAAAPAPIRGSDRDPGAVEAARANAARAGVDGDIDWGVHPLSAIAGGEPAGSLVTNPPYGVRVGDRPPLRDLYATLGNLRRERLSGWAFAMLSADEGLERATGLELRQVLRTRNGGIGVRLMVG